MELGPRYRVVLPDGEEWLLNVDPDASVAEVYALVASRLGLEPCGICLMRQTHVGAALPFLRIEPSQEQIRRVAQQGGTLKVELAVDSAPSAGAPGPAAPAPAEGRAPADPGRRAAGHGQAGAGRAPESRGLCGLQNFGNTCYLNSALQCLSQTTGLREPLLAEPVSVAGGGATALRGGGSADGRVMEAFRGVLGTLWSTDGSEPIAPRSLKTSLLSRTRVFEGSGQQDAQELVQALLEALHEDLKRVPLSGRGAAEAQAASADAVWERALASDSSLVSDLFQGQLRSAVRCGECGRLEVTFELFWSLPLPIPTASDAHPREGPPALADALGAFCREEPLEECSWRCPGCDRPVCGTKCFTLWRLPRILQLHLKRFEWRRPAETVRNPSSGATAPAAAAEAGAAPSASQGDSAGNQSSLSAKAAEHRKVETTVPMDVDAPARPGTNGSSAEGTGFAAVPGDPLGLLISLPWEQQERAYALVLKVLERIAKDPGDPKFRCVSKGSQKLRQELLDLPGGEALLRWAGFDDIGDHFKMPTSTSGSHAEERAKDLRSRAEAVRDRLWRRARDQRIEEERQRRMPRGDGSPVRRWRGCLPTFARGAAGAIGLECSKVAARVTMTADSSRRRGLAPLRLDELLDHPAPAAAGGAPLEYELYAVIQHIGATPFSGHYVAHCWHEPSGAWWRFDDSHVTRLPAERVADEVLTGGSYVLLLERSAGSAPR